ncbi:hypothetical protein ACFLWC_05160 [Chloroflexota bacterium]
MEESRKEEIILMAVLMVTKDDVLAFANELGIPGERVTEHAFELVKEKVSQGFDRCREAVKDMIKEAIKCPLSLDCSPSCPWREVGECLSSRKVD